MNFAEWLLLLLIGLHLSSHACAWYWWVAVPTSILAGILSEALLGNKS